MLFLGYLCGAYHSMLSVLSIVWSGGGVARSVWVVHTTGKQGFPTPLLQVQMSCGGGGSWRVSGRRNLETPFVAPLSLVGIMLGEHQCNKTQPISSLRPTWTIHTGKPCPRNRTETSTTASFRRLQPGSVRSSLCEFMCSCSTTTRCLACLSGTLTFCGEAEELAQGGLVLGCRTLDGSHSQLWCPEGCSEEALLKAPAWL